MAVPRPVLEPARALCDRLKGSYIELDRTCEIVRLILPGQRQVDLSAWVGDTLEDDLRRRDFTINAMGQRLSDGRLVDPCGGRADLEARLLRPTSPQVFAEDPLRLLRAVRFLACQQLTAHPTLDPLLAEHHARLAGVSPERVRDELALILGCGMTSQLARLKSTGLFGLLFAEADTTLLERLEADDLSWAPEGTGAWLEQPLAGPRTRRQSLALAALGSCFPQPANSERRYVERVRASGALQVGPDRGERYRWLRRLGPEAVDACVLAHQVEPRPHLAELIRSSLEQDEVAAPRLAVDGHDLMRELGLEAGPELGQRLENLAAYTAVHGPQSREQALRLVRSKQV